MLSKCYKSTEVDRRTWLHVPSGTLWSTTSDTHQVVQVKCACQIYDGSIYHRHKVKKKLGESKEREVPKSFFVLGFGDVLECH